MKRAWRHFVLMGAVAIALAGGTLRAAETDTGAIKPLRTLEVDAEKGNDDSEAGPFKTLQKAAKASKPGDLVVVHKGQYAGFIMGWDFPDDHMGGTAEAPITFKADEGAVIISRDGKTPNGIDLEHANYVTIDGFAINNADGSITRAGIRIEASDHVTVRNVTADHCGTWGIFTSFSERLTIENNVCSNSKGQHGIYVSNSADDPVVRGNKCFGNRQCGIQLNADFSEKGDGTHKADGLISGALIENNVIYDNGAGGGSGINCDGVTDSRIQNNLLYGNHASGISLFDEDGASGSSRNVVVNNTIVMAADARWALNIKNKSIDNTAYNNILLNLSGKNGAINISEDSLAGFFSDNNVLDGRFAFDDEKVFEIDKWHAETLMDKHSVLSTAARVFEDVEKNDFRPMANSVAVGAGTSRPVPADAPMTDMEGAAKAGGAKPTIGALEAGTKMLPVGGMLETWPGREIPLLLTVLGAGLLGLFVLSRRGMQGWFVNYCMTAGARRDVAATDEVHLMICIGDHYEPHNGGVSDAKARERLAKWMEQYPALYGDVKDSDGRVPQHTFFYPIEQYNFDEVEGIATLCRAGFGEIEVHLHHDADTAETLRRRLEEGKRKLAGHGAMAHHRVTGEIAYGFIHGDWALDNSHPKGHCCGVNNELDVLRETGCYADFTLPSAPDAAQTRKINSIYYAVDDPAKPKSHDTGVEVGAGDAPANGFMLIQGPLLLNWGRRKWGILPRIENGCLQGNHPASMDRVDLWLRARVQVPTRPDWFFAKLHCHGANEDGQRGLLGPAMVKFHRELAERARKNARFHYHYVTAREMYNLVKAAEAGWKGSVDAARNYVLLSNQVRLERKKTA